VEKDIYSIKVSSFVVKQVLSMKKLKNIGKSSCLLLQNTQNCKT